MIHGQQNIKLTEHQKGNTWGGRRDQKLFITNWHKTKTKVVVGRREQHEVKRRQRKTNTESLQTYAASVIARAIQLTFLSETQSVIPSL
jgi:hypothetical protein